MDILDGRLDAESERPIEPWKERVVDSSVAVLLRGPGSDQHSGVEGPTIRSCRSSHRNGVLQNRLGFVPL